MILFLKARHHLDFFNRPTPAQTKAGNYKKPKIKIAGMDISIENPRGTLRSGVDKGGNAWQVGMRHHYGYILGTLGVDGDHFDCFIGPNHEAPTVWIVTSMKPPGFKVRDEQKAMIGFITEDDARRAFLDHYDNPKFLGSITEKPIDEFRREVMTTRETPRFMKGWLITFPSDGCANEGNTW